MRTPSRIIAVANLSPILSPFAMPHASRSPLGMNSAALALKHSAVAALTGSCVNAYASAVHARDQTVVALVGPTSRQWYEGRSFFCLGPTNPLRLLVIGLVEWPWFERVVLAAIVVNCVMLGFDGPPSVPDSPEREAANLALLVLFSVELFCKVVAMGLVGSPHAFLRDGWHVVDAFLVASGWLEIVTEASNYTALRCLRALRPL